MEEAIKKAVEQLHRDYQARDKKSYTDHYLLLRRLESIIELIGREKLSSEYQRYYEIAEGYVDRKPEKEDDNNETAGLSRELSLVIPELKVIINN